MSELRQFTNDQRKLFKLVRLLNRTRLQDFAEADQWLTQMPVTAFAEAAHERRCVLHEIRHRRKCTSRRRIRNESSPVVLFGGKDPTYGLGPHVGLIWQRWWSAYKASPYAPDVQEYIATERLTRARNIRATRNYYARRVLREQPFGPLELGVFLLTSRIAHNSDDVETNDEERKRHGPVRINKLFENAVAKLCTPEPAFDLMEPEQVIIWGRRVLRAVWIMTDPADLEGAFASWRWNGAIHGEDRSAHLWRLIHDFRSCDCLQWSADEVSRAYAASNRLDQELEYWEALANRAIEGMGEIDPEAIKPRTPEPRMDAEGSPDESAATGILTARVDSKTEAASREADAGHSDSGAVPNTPLVGGDADEGNEESPYLFRLNGDYWDVSFNEERGHYQNIKGFGIIAKLLRFPNPSQPMTAADLLGRLDAVEEQTHEPVIDDDARSDYRQEIADYDRDIERANEAGDAPKAESLMREKEEVMDQIRAVTSLGGAIRILPHKSAEVAARQAVSRAYDRLREGMPKLVTHLKNTIRIGQKCTYHPPHPPLPWQLD